MFERGDQITFAFALAASLVGMAVGAVLSGMDEVAEGAVSGIALAAVMRLIERRQGGPIVRTPGRRGPGYWSVLGHPELGLVLRDPATFSSFSAVSQSSGPAGQGCIGRSALVFRNSSKPGWLNVAPLATSVMSARPALSRRCMK